MIEALVYVMANPVAAGLVQTAAEWPGVLTLPRDLGCATWSVRRASRYFDPNNPAWPETATLTLTLPPLEMSADDLRAAVQTELQALERAAHEQMRAKGWHFIGRARLAALSPFARARSWEPLRGRNPTFAVGRGQREAFRTRSLQSEPFAKHIARHCNAGEAACAMPPFHPRPGSCAGCTAPPRRRRAATPFRAAGFMVTIERMR